MRPPYSSWTEAITLCEAEGPPDQLAVCLPAAARHCWDVGAVTEARGYLDRSWALLGEGRRIAHADLLTAATAVALGDGDLDAAVEHGTAAEAEAAGLGIDRNLPFVRALLARALLGRGDVDQAARMAADAVRSGRELSVQYPVADALEAAAAVSERVGAPAEDVAALLAAAAEVRARGERPAPRAAASRHRRAARHEWASRGRRTRRRGCLRPGRAAPAGRPGRLTARAVITRSLRAGGSAGRVAGLTRTRSHHVPSSLVRPASPVPHS